MTGARSYMGNGRCSITPDDMLLLDRVARALLAQGGRENAEKSLQYSRAFEEYIKKAPAPAGGDAGRKEDERERGLSRSLLYQFRAQAVLGEKAEAERLAAQAYQMFPCEEAAREWSNALVTSGKDADALQRVADAFVIPDSRAADTDRAEDRQRLGELYRKLHHDDKGLGDLILTAYDRTAAQVAEHRNRLLALDPNMGATDPMQFTLTGLDGKKLALKSLKGSVVVFDFWATWCVPCRAQHPLYEQVKERFKNRNDVVFVAVATDEDRLLVAPYLDKQTGARRCVTTTGCSGFLQVTAYSDHGPVRQAGAGGQPHERVPAGKIRGSIERAHSLRLVRIAVVLMQWDVCPPMFTGFLGPRS